MTMVGDFTFSLSPFWLDIHLFYGNYLFDGHFMSYVSCCIIGARALSLSLFLLRGHI